MENKNIIVVLIAIIIALLIVCSILAMQTFNKARTEITFEGNSTIIKGDSLVVKLSDDNGNPIANKTLNINLLEKNGTTINKDITTDSKGNAKFKMEEEGQYLVDCYFDGDSHYASSSNTVDITVNEATTELINEEKTSTSSTTNKYAPDGSIYPEYGPEVDSYGVTREYAIANNMHYIEMNIDGKIVGGYTAIDPNTGTYHT